jgi:hypothetical protein
MHRRKQTLVVEAPILQQNTKLAQIEEKPADCSEQNSSAAKFPKLNPMRLDFNDHQHA